MGLQRNLVDQLYNILKERIITLVLEPGARIKLQQLAKKFEVSETPIREALARLSRDELVKVIPAAGYYVIKLSTKDVMEIYDLRKLLEGYALTSSVVNMDVKKLRKIRQKIKKQQYEPQILDEELHLEIVKNCDNKRLQDLYARIYNFVKICQYTHQRRSQRTTQTTEEHLALIDAILEKNIKKAKQILKKHIDNARDVIIGVLEEQLSTKEPDPVR